MIHTTVLSYSVILIFSIIGTTMYNRGLDPNRGESEFHSRVLTTPSEFRKYIHQENFVINTPVGEGSSYLGVYTHGSKLDMKQTLNRNVETNIGIMICSDIQVDIRYMKALSPTSQISY